MGYACAHVVWKSQVDALLGSSTPYQILILDNRGIGQSDCPKDPTAYTTDIMARDAASIAEMLGWEAYHLIGHSMGGMIASKLAALHPTRILSLCLISTCGGGLRDLWPPFAAFKLLPQLLRAKRSQDPRDRVAFDLKCHYSRRYLRAPHVDEPKRSRREVLMDRYLWGAERDGKQPEAGDRGHFHAVNTHRLSVAERAVVSALPTVVVHSRQDIIITWRGGARLAKSLGCALVLLDGGHMLTVERAAEVNALIHALVLGRGARGAAAVEKDVDIDAAAVGLAGKEVAVGSLEGGSIAPSEVVLQLQLAAASESAGTAAELQSGPVVPTPP